MSFILGIVLVSGVMLILLTFLFCKEAIAGKRIIFPTAREWGDDFLRTTYASVIAYIETHNVIRVRLRVFLHFCIHRLLGWSHTFLEFCDTRIIRLQKKNKIIARSVREGGTLTQLEQVVAHKEQIRNSGRGA